nr:protein OPI10 homolog [Ipomoea batatas]
MFGVVFPNRSFPMDISSFTQIDTTHWLLDMNTFVGEAYDSIREVCIFLLNNFTLPPDKALAVYIQSPGSPFLFCGAVTLSRPSAVLSLPWPEPGGELQLTADATPLSAKIGVSVEELATLPSLDVAAEKKIERLAMKVGENLFNFMQSFCGVDGSKLIVPMDILDRWFKKFQERAKRDPEYLKGFFLHCFSSRRQVFSCIIGKRALMRNLNAEILNFGCGLYHMQRAIWLSDTAIMKYLEYTPLDSISDFLSHINLGERTVKGCLEAYSCKHTGTDKKLSLSLENEPKDIDIFASYAPSNLSRLQHQTVQRTVARRRAESSTNAHQLFSEESWDSFKQVFDIYMFEASKEWLETNESSSLLATLYKALDEVVKVPECEIYGYNPDSDADPCEERGAIWSYHFLFYNKKLKRIVSFRFSCVSNLDLEDGISY